MTVVPDETAALETREDNGGSVLEVETDDPGRLIGRQGQTLSELQYITNRLLFRVDPSVPKVTVLRGVDVPTTTRD